MNENIEFLKDGEIGLVMFENGRIIQLGIDKRIYDSLLLMLGTLTKNHPLVKMSEKHDLILKNKKL